MQNTNLFILLISLIINLNLIRPYCVSSDTSNYTSSYPSGHLNKQIVKNFTYKLEMGMEKDGKIYNEFKLSNGKYRNRDLLVNIKLEKFQIAHLNDDGIRDAIVILAGNYGGSGTFYELTALIGGNPIRQTNSIELGDRVIIHGLNIKKMKVKDQPNLKVCINLTTHKPTDPMCCPSEKREICFRLEKGQILESAQCFFINLSFIMIRFCNP